MGVDRIVDQVVNPKIYSSFLPKVEEVVQHCLKLDDNDKPVFVAPPRVQQPPQPLRFKDRHNLAPRAKVPAPRKALTLLVLTLLFNFNNNSSFNNIATFIDFPIMLSTEYLIHIFRIGNIFVNLLKDFPFQM